MPWCITFSTVYGQADFAVFTPKHIACTAVFPKPDYAAVLAFALYSAVNALKVLTERLSALQRNAERKRWHAHCVEKEFQGALKFWWE